MLVFCGWLLIALGVIGLIVVALDTRRQPDRGFSLFAVALFAIVFGVIVIQYAQGFMQ
jgi:uncharacterized membrane protein YbaN (DUF454 family)